MEAAKMEGISISNSKQYQTNCLVITKKGLNPDEVIEYAYEKNAIYTDADGDQFVVDFQIPGENRRVGPELYSENALRSSL